MLWNVMAFSKILKNRWRAFSKILKNRWRGYTHIFKFAKGAGTWSKIFGFACLDSGLLL